MAKTQTTGVGLSTAMRPVKHYGSAQKKTKAQRVRQFGIPGLGRVAFSRDPGEASLLSGNILQTRLSAIVRNPYGEIVEQRELGSGLVTNVGVLALAFDYVTDAASTAGFNLFSNLKWHAWGTGTTAAATTDIKLQTLGKPNETEATEATTVAVTTNGEGKPKLVSTSKITASSSLAITEWGIHTQKKLSETPGTGKFVSVTSTSGKGSGAVFTASTTSIKGERLKIANFTESAEGWGLVTASSTEVLTVPAWYLQSTGAVKEPTGTSAYTLKPVMFDHRVFAAINVESGNIIEFPWELEIKSGG